MIFLSEIVLASKLGSNNLVCIKNKTFKCSTWKKDLDFLAFSFLCLSSKIGSPPRYLSFCLK